MKRGKEEGRKERGMDSRKRRRERVMREGKNKGERKRDVEKVGKKKGGWHEEMREGKKCRKKERRRD